MTALTKALLFLLIFSTHLLRAEDPVELGFQGAINAFKTIPSATAKEAERAAGEILRPFLKPTPGGFYILRKGSTTRWIEVRGLRVTRTFRGTLSQADRSNGVTERILVSYSASMHRDQRSDQAWSEWKNGKPGFLPPVIRVDKKNGRWSGSATILGTLKSCNDQPITIPSAATPPTRLQAPTQPITHPPSPPKAKPRSQPKPTPKTASTAETTSTDTPLALDTKTFINGFLSAFSKLGILLVVALAIVALTKKSGRKSRKPDSPPPALPKRHASPPPLPAESYRNPLDLITRRETLMTPAEQKFFAVLEPLVSPACMISSKVRLADLFEVREAPGQQAAFNKICSKHIDFVLTEPGTSRILCGIELDDRSHQRPERIERDRFVNQLFASKGLPLLRAPCASSYDADALHQSLATLLGRPLAA